jgi:hypothetical protein
MKDKQSSVDLLWNLIPKDIQNMIEKQFDGYNKAKEMEKEQMRLDIEKKWEQYRIITNNEDAWSFKEWLIKQTYGGNNV